MKKGVLILVGALLCAFILNGCTSPKDQGTNTGDNSSGVIYDYEIPDDVDIDIDVDDAPTE